MFLPASALLPWPVEVSKLDARPATAPLRPNVRDAASFVASLCSAQLHEARRHPLFKRYIGRCRGLQQRDLKPVLTVLVGGRKGSAETTEAVVCKIRNWRASLAHTAAVATLLRARWRCAACKSILQGILQRCLRGDPSKVPHGILRSSRNTKAPHEGSCAPRSPPFGSWTLTKNRDNNFGEKK